MQNEIPKQMKAVSTLHVTSDFSVLVMNHWLQNQCFYIKNSLVKCMFHIFKSWY